ncbi:hypothetical protein IFR05_005496 [Cadophora sp. M221]|nr:hypothetical protein IFR05_005496 [Cadophora sp. M221]
MADLDEVNDEVYGYSAHRPCDNDRVLFNDTKGLPIIDSDFFEDANACVGYNAAHSTIPVENETIEDELCLENFDDVNNSESDIFDIAQALEEFDFRSAAGQVPAQRMQAVQEVIPLEQWYQNLERHEMIAVGFQQPPYNRTPYTNVRRSNVVVAERPQHREISDADAQRTDLNAPVLPGHLAAEQTQQMSSPISGGSHSSLHLDPAVEDEQNIDKLDQDFTAVLLSLKEIFLSKAIQELTQSESPECNEVRNTGNVTSSPGLNERSGAPSSSFNADFAGSGTGFARKRANEGSEKDGDKGSRNGKKKQKEVHGPNDGSPDIRKLACPFRKHSPEKFHWRNPRYKTCATGSWGNIGKLKDSHIYRNHTARCSGCKDPMKALLQFQNHRKSEISTNPKTKCIASEGLFEQEIEGLRNLKLRGLGAEKGWNEIYKYLFPNSTPIPDPWWDPPTDDLRPCSDKEELTRRLVAYLEGRFQSEYDQIVASKEEILQSLIEMIPELYTATPPNREPIPTPEFDNGEGPSMGQWQASLPVPNNHQTANDELVSNSFQDTEIFDFDRFNEEFGSTRGSPVIVDFDGRDESSNGGAALEVGFNHNLEIYNMDVPQVSSQTRCTSSRSEFLQRSEDIPGGFDGNSYLGKGKGIDLGPSVSCELSKEYQDGHRAGFEQGKSYGYRTGWNKGHISGYSAGMKVAEEGYAQLRDFQASSTFNDCGI